MLNLTHEYLQTAVLTDHEWEAVLDAPIPGIDVDYASTAAEYRAELRRERELERLCRHA